MAAFGSIFHHHESLLSHLSQAVEKPLRHAVGPSAYNQAVHLVCPQCLIIERKEAFGGSVRIGVGLKVGKIAHGRILSREKLLPGLNLCGHTLCR